MSYTELLDRFWGMKWSKSHNEIILFHYLLYRCSSLGWPDTFSVSNEDIMQTLKCSPNTVRAARKALVDTGFVCYKQGDGRGGLTFYSFVADEETDEAKKGSSREHLSAKRVQVENTFSQKRVQAENTFSKVNGSKSADEETDEAKKGSSREHLSAQLKTEQKKQTKKKPLPAPTEKEKNKEKKKEITQSKTLLLHKGSARMHTHEDEATGQIEIVFNELKEKPLKKNREATEPILPHDMNEVLSFFETNGRELQDWKADAEAFFYHFDSVGWMGTSNRKIQDWKSRAHLWIADKIVKQKQQSQKSNGTTTNQSNSTRESRLSDAASLIDDLLRQNKLEG